MTAENLSKENCKKTLLAMGNEDFTNNLIALLKSRHPLLYLITNEEKRLLAYYKYLCIAYGYDGYVWDCYKGLLNILDNSNVTADDAITDADTVLDFVVNDINECNISKMHKLKNEGIRGKLFLLLDFYRYLEDAEPDTERRLKAIFNDSQITSVIITGPRYEATECTDDLFAVLDFPYPNEEEIRYALWNAIDRPQLVSKLPNLKDSVKKNEDEIIKSAKGLTLADTQIAFAKSIVLHKDLHINTILQEKKQKIRKKEILEYFEPNVSLSDVGGLHNLVEWINRRKLAFNNKAEEYGLTPPKGLMLLGAPGTGKSLVCKSIAAEYNMPLLILDFGKLFGSLVGQSEAAAREAIKLAESLAPCILAIDEIEKGLSGSRTSGQTDGGTTSRVVSTFLTWMQEKTDPVFVVCTANDHRSIPPEFMRAGRFDEVFFVDLPSYDERKEIFEVLLKKKKRKPKNFDLDKLSSISKNYSGAEIEKSIEVALFEGFYQKKKDIDTEDIVKAIGTFQPLSQMRNEEYKEMKSWAEKTCIMANSNMQYNSQEEQDSINNIDLD